ncbi:MAG: hypothetical protein U0414_24390 [Polyangiaceae bacterium]
MKPARRGTRRDAPRAVAPTSRLWGIFGAPYANLEPHLDLSSLPEVDREITRGLAEVESGYTGGTLKWMGVVAPWVRDDAYLDAMDVIEALDDEEFSTFLELSEDPSAFDRTKRRDYTFGDETPYPFTRAQTRWLAYRHRVYFPWKVCYHLLENDRWDDKHSGAGKAFGEEAREVFPKTVALIESLPFTEVGRVVIFGLEPNDHAPLHRDTEPGAALGIAQSISICPRGDKRFFLQNDEGAEPEIVRARAYWFNDMDYHGVLPDPFFRYSIRVDGAFDPAFLARLSDR